MKDENLIRVEELSKKFCLGMEFKISLMIYLVGMELKSICALMNFGL
jgi:hypothetical protein